MRIFIGCTSSEDLSDSYRKETKTISSFLASREYDLVIGGVNKNGIFSILINEFTNRKIDLITLPIYKEDVPDNINVSYVDSTFDRCKRCYNMADKVLLLPGGIGTLCEIFAMLEEARTFDNKELIIFNFNNYYAKTLEMIVEVIKHKFVDKSILDRIKVFNTSEDLINYMEGIE